MTEIANFKIEQFGAEVATISENEEQVVEVQRHSDGALTGC